eukprot:6472045-Amphidinium_carterae.1
MQMTTLARLWMHADPRPKQLRRPLHMLESASAGTKCHALTTTRVITMIFKKQLSAPFLIRWLFSPTLQWEQGYFGPWRTQTASCKRFPTSFLHIPHSCLSFWHCPLSLYLKQCPFCAGRRPQCIPFFILVRL